MFLNSLYLSNMSDVSGLISKVKERKYITRILNFIGSIEINMLVLWVEDSTIAVCNMFYLLQIVEGSILNNNYVVGY